MSDIRTIFLDLGAASPDDASLPYRHARWLVVDQFECSCGKALLARTGDNVRQAARGARMDRSFINCDEPIRTPA
jgi:hypothetical protein